MSMVEAYPGWRRALELVLELRPMPGDIIPFEWLYEAMRIERPTAQTAAAAARRAELRFLAGFSRLERELLEEHCIALANVRGEGYRVVPPAEQTAWAEGEARGELAKHLRKAGRRLRFVDHGALTDAQRRQNADAIARLAGLRVAMRDTYRQLPPPPPPRRDG